MAFANKRIKASSHKVPVSASRVPLGSKSGVLAALTLFFIFLTTSVVLAQLRGEALWRVDNNRPSQPVPLYDGAPSPFPIKEPPPPPEPEEPEESEVVIEPEPRLTPAERAAQRRAERASSIMSRIRDKLTNDNAFEPDFSSLVVEAIVSGKAGETAFIKGDWKFEGDYVETTVQTKKSLMGLISKLRQANEDLADTVETEIQEKRKEIGSFNLLIKDVDSKGVTLRLPEGSSHVINFNSKGW